MQVIVDNILTSYKKYGSGKKVILCLHGWADSSESFEMQAKLLPKQYTAILLDLPGFGGSSKPPASWGIPQYADFAGKFIKKIDMEPYGVIGHSNGGAIAIFAVGSKIIAAERLILIASSGLRSAISAKKIIYKILAKAAKVFIFILPKGAQKKIKQRLYGKIGSDYMVAEDLKENFKKIVSYDVSSDAKKIKTPTLLIYGEDDLITPLIQARKIASYIEDSKLEIISKAGHFPHKDQPEKAREIIEDFLK